MKLILFGIALFIVGIYVETIPDPTLWDKIRFIIACLAVGVGLLEKSNA